MNDQATKRCKDGDESLVTRSLRRFVEGLSDPTLLVSLGYQVLFANAEARVRYSLLTGNGAANFQEFLKSAFPDSRWSDVEIAFKTALDDDGAEPALVILAHGLKQTHMRVSTMAFDQDCHCGDLETVYAVTLFDPDGDAIMRRLEFILDSSTDGIFIVNRRNQIVFFNKACEKLTGWKRGAAVVQTYECSNVLRCHNDAGESMGSDHLCPAKVFFHRDSVPKPHEMLITTTSGKEKYVETNYSPIKNGAGEVEFIVGIIRDVDERKRLEDQLVQNRNLALLGQLVSGIAHEIKNPLGILMSSVEIVLNEKRPQEQRKEAASYIKDEVRRLDERMKYFLAFARPKPLFREPTDINSLLSKVCSSYQSALINRRFIVETSFGPGLPSINVDPDLLHQVFLNLIINAVQAMPRGGVLKISTEATEDMVRIRFVDNGQGISPENLPRIFDPFFTTKADGTGLGLSIVHQILTSHRGRILVRNNDPSPGVCFEILLPVDEQGN